MTLHEHLIANPNEAPADTVAWWIAELNKETKDYTMPDISMCGSEECSRKTTCRRNPASGTVPGEWQSWGGFDHKNCNNYWPVLKKKGLKKLIDEYLEDKP